jgi:hypothetical protein
MKKHAICLTFALFTAGLLSAVAQETASSSLASSSTQPPVKTRNFVAKFLNATGGLGNSQVFDNGTFVGVGTATPVSRLHVSGNGTGANQTAAAIEIANTAPGGTENWWLRVGATGNNTPAGGFSLGNSDAYWMTVTFNGNFGLGFNVNNPTHKLEMQDTANEDNGTWNNASDRNLKENFATVDHAQLLSKVNSMSIETWNYKADKSVRHLGPMGQDFYAAFGLGEDDKHISTVDEGGVALAAVQELYRMVVKSDKELESLTQASREKDACIEALSAKVEQLQKLEQTVQLLSTKLENIEAGEGASPTILRASK